MTPYEAGYADGLYGRKSRIAAIPNSEKEEYIRGFIAGRRERRGR